MKNVTVNLDLGNSGTRVLVETGDFKGKVRDTKFFEMDNRLSEIIRFNGSRYDSRNFNDTNSVVFKVAGATLNGQPVNQMVAAGDIARKEFSMTYSAPDVLMPKYNNTSTMFNTIRALFRVLRYLKTFEGNEELDYSSLAVKYHFNLTILLPPEQADNQKTLVEDLKNMPSLEFLLPEAEIKFNIDDVSIQQEGYTAFFGALFDRRTKEPRAKFANEISKRILVVDVGEGTTDLMLVDGGVALESSKRTLNMGGANVISQARLSYSKDTNTDYARELFLPAVLTGKLTVGNQQIDVVDYINESKFMISFQLVNNIKDYLMASNIPVETISHLLIVGGGTLKAENPEIETFGKYIGDNFKKIAPSTNIIDVNEIDTNSDMFGEDPIFNARTVNVIGASILTDVRDASAK